MLLDRQQNLLVSCAQCRHESGCLLRSDASRGAIPNHLFCDIASAP